MSEIEVFRITPTIGKNYYAILATTRTVWDNDIPAPWGKGNNRYYAPANHKRYMGTFISSHSYGSGDGKVYMEIYIKNGKRIELKYDYDGKTCLIEVDKAPDSEDSKSVPIDAQISPIQTI